MCLESEDMYVWRDDDEEEEESWLPKGIIRFSPLFLFSTTNTHSTKSTNNTVTRTKIAGLTDLLVGTLMGDLVGLMPVVPWSMVDLVELYEFHSIVGTYEDHAVVGT